MDGITFKPMFFAKKYYFFIDNCHQKSSENCLKCDQCSQELTIYKNYTSGKQHQSHHT